MDAIVYPARACPICLSLNSNILFHQEFEVLSKESLLAGYDLVLCQNCGATYADKIPAQPMFDRYYADMSKYTFSHQAGAINRVDAERFAQTVDFISPHISLDESIADIGCATGGLLAEFKKRGFSNLTGFDPSPACVLSAKRLYNLEVRESSIHDLDQVAERFDLVILTGVLEHLGDVDSSLALLTRLLKRRGRIYIEVPDASSYHQWYSAPFQFLSMEHVNFFSPVSLSNLFRRHGFEVLFADRVVRHLSAKAVEPAVAGLFRHTGESKPMIHDAESGPNLTRYIEQSRSIEIHIHEIIDKLVKNQVPLAVWGAGTHTLRLLRTSNLPKANIIAFLDSNAVYQGKKLQDIPVVSPDQFSNAHASILISSHVAEQEIADQIETKLKWANPVIRLYGNVPLERTPD